MNTWVNYHKTYIDWVLMKQYSLSGDTRSLTKHVKKLHFKSSYIFSVLSDFQRVLHT